ncbi:hypothetical protein [Haladaptatus sp. DFWS20]|uniref:hypothetical protein n=1 Tax=Haladaptatus sp. DFWS20 TaxID=3403467 RepID=UPI003EBB083D
MANNVAKSYWRLFGMTLVAALLGFTIWAVAFPSVDTIVAIIIAAIILAIMRFVEGCLTSNSSKPPN